MVLQIASGKPKEDRTNVLFSVFSFSFMTSNDVTAQHVEKGANAGEKNHAAIPAQRSFCIIGSF